MDGKEFLYKQSRRTLYSLIQAHMLSVQSEFKAAGMNDKYIEDRIKECVAFADTRLEALEKEISAQVTAWEKKK